MFVRQSGAAAHFDAVDLSRPDVIAPIDEELGPRDRRMRSARTNLWIATGRFDRAAVEWEAMMRRYPDEPGAQRTLEQLRRRAQQSRHSR